MPLFRRPGKGVSKNERDSESQPLNRSEEEDEESLPEIDKETTKKAQEVMLDHLDIMRDVVMKIRHQDGYAKAMYANCPRLQHLLDRNPDLRPVFEDPRLVRINFETVYKEAGGILPEDEEEEERKRNNPSLIMRIANHPIFKFLKVLIFLKKIIGCITGGGIALISGCWGCFADCCTDCCCEEHIEEVGEIHENGEGEQNEYGLDADAPLDENQRALNTAADYMEDPEVQEQMQRLLEDPDNLEDAIENDAELRALRDSNPLCAELMNDPDTMKILVDPDNLRALGEAPQMIELDFTDPHGFSPQADFVDIEAGDLDMEASGGGDDFLEASGSMDGLEAYDADYDEAEIDFPMEDDMDGAASLAELQEMEEAPWDDEGLEAENPAPEEIELTEEEAVSTEEPVATSGIEDDFELEQAESSNADAAKKGKGSAKSQKKDQGAANGSKRGGLTGVITSLGVAATDVIAAQIVGDIFGSDMLPGDLLGGGDMGPDLGGLESAADHADTLVNDDVAALAEDTTDDIDDEKDAHNSEAQTDARSSRTSIEDTGRKNYIGLMGASAATAAAAASLSHINKEEESLDDGLQSIGEESDHFEDEENANKSEDKKDGKKPKSKVFGAFKSLASATVTAAKEHVAGALLGDDLAEMLIEKQEERGESSSEDENEKDKDEKKKKRFHLFGRKKGDGEYEEEDDFIISEEMTKSFKIDQNEEEYDPYFDANNPECSFAANKTS